MAEGIVSQSILQIKYLYRVNAQICMNVLDYRNEIAYDGLSHVAVCDQAVTQLKDPATNPLLANMIALMCQACTFTEVTAQFIFPVRYVVRKAEINRTGASVGTCPAQNVAATISKYGDEANRHSLGSAHFGGLASSAYVSGVIAAATLTTLEDLALNVRTVLNFAAPPTTWYPIITNKRPIAGSDPVRFEIYGSTRTTVTKVNPSLRVMRRRTLGQGI